MIENQIKIGEIDNGSSIHDIVMGIKSASWVIKNKETGEILFETFDRNIVDKLNTMNYIAVPILQYLQELNYSIKKRSHTLL